jgi:hypothetical protein
MRLSLVSLALLPLVACGGDDDGGNNPPVLVDAAVSVDAPPTNTNCTASPTYSVSLDDTNSYAESYGTGPDGYVEGAGLLNEDATPDLLVVELYGGIGPFANGITTQSITIAGDEANYATCAACVRIFTDTTQDSFADQYFASGGTMNLTSIRNTLELTLSNVTLQHVTIDPNTFESTPVGDGCTTTVNATFSTPIDEIDALRSKNAPIRLRMQRVTKR